MYAMLVRVRLIDRARWDMGEMPRVWRKLLVAGRTRYLLSQAVVW